MEDVLFQISNKQAVQRPSWTTAQGRQLAYPRETDLLELGSERLKAARGPGHGTT